MHRARVDPRHQGGDAGSLIPGVLPPELDACLCGHIDRDIPATHVSEPPPTTTTTPWPFRLKIAHAQIEKCISLMVKSLGKFLLGRQFRRNRGAPPAPVVEYITPAPEVISSSKPVVEFLARASSGICNASGGAYCTRASSVSSLACGGVYCTPASCVSSANASSGVHYTAVFQAPTPVVESVAPVPVVFHGPVFPLSLDASDVSSPEDEYKCSWESLPVAIKSFTQVESLRSP